MLDQSTVTFKTFEVTNFQWESNDATSQGSFFTQPHQVCDTMLTPSAARREQSRGFVASGRLSGDASQDEATDHKGPLAHQLERPSRHWSYFQTPCYVQATTR